jgi:peptidoglycan/xylan/chitin deacetylase (PgdA/CDA1 family)
MLTILTYHSIDRVGLVTSIRPDRFAAHMAFLAEHRFQVLALDQIVSMLGSATSIPPRCVAITFDDGYRSVYTEAFATLRRHSFPATVFVTSGHCGGLSNWPSHGPEMSHHEMLGGAELRELRAHGVTIGAHTVNHNHLTGLPLPRAQREIEDSRVELEQIVGEAVRHFAYPYGESNAELRALAARTFISAYGTDLRLARLGDDIYNLPRIDAYYLDEVLRLGGPESPMGRAYLSVRRPLRRARAAFRRVGSSQL